MNSTQPLFYRNPEPLDKIRHKGLGVAEKGSFSFASHANAVILTAMEFALASRSYPIFFTTGDEPLPVALLGLRNQENLFVRDGKWAESAYIPAYIRRYPFAFLESPNRKTLTLCIDVESDAVVRDSATKFFDQIGEPSEFTRKALEFCRSFQAQYSQTRELGALLKRHELLVSRQADITLPTGDKTAVRDFLMVDETRLNALGDGVFLEFRKAGLLPPIYFHLMSLANLRDLAERMARMSASSN